MLNSKSERGHGIKGEKRWPIEENDLEDMKKAF